MESSVNQRVKELRESYILSINGFAKKLEVSPTAIHKIEGGGGVSKRLLKKMIDTFNVNAAWLMEGEGEMLRSTKPKEKEDGSYREKLAGDLLHFRGVLIGKLGEKTWKELEPYFPKSEVYSYSL